MSVLLTSLPAPTAVTRVATAARPRLTVSMTTHASDLRILQRLRYRIYVEELGLVPANHRIVQGQRLVDPYDDWSTHLLLRCGDEPIGGLRLTEAAEGPMELSQHTPVTPYLPADARPIEVGRFMVAHPYRKTLAGPLLGYGFFLLMAKSQATHAVTAYGEGPLAAYYQRIGFRPFPDAVFFHGLVGKPQMLARLSLGAPGCLRRRKLMMWAHACKLAVQCKPSLVHRMVGRQRGRPATVGRLGAGRPLGPRHTTA